MKGNICYQEESFTNNQAFHKNITEEELISNIDDYAKDLKEQQDKIDEINKKIELAKKDNSMSGKSKLKELLDELKEAQNDLNDKIQSKTDSDIDDMFQSQLDALDKKKEDMTQDIDDTYTQQKIAQMVKDAMMTNTFTDLNGNITNLQDK